MLSLLRAFTTLLEETLSYIIKSLHFTTSTKVGFESDPKTYKHVNSFFDIKYHEMDKLLMLVLL